MSPPARSRSRHSCPQCGGLVKRVLRDANDKRRWDADQWRRYRCRSDSCNWRGLLQVSSGRRARAPAEASVSATARMGRAALWLLAAGGLTWAALQALQFMMAS